MSEKRAKNIVFDLGGVVFRRDPKKCTLDFIDFFSFVRFPKMPRFWEEYDRGTLTLDEVIDLLSRDKGVSREKAAEYVRLAINKQEAIIPTERLIADLKSAGYRLFVLSNMSREFIDFLRLQPVYQHFEGDVVSCEELTVKPEREIYERLLSRFELEPSDTLFIDDREANIVAAKECGIEGFLFNHNDPESSCEKLRQLLL